MESVEARQPEAIGSIEATRGRRIRREENVQVELRDRRQVHKLSGDEKTTEEQLNNATSPHSSIPHRSLFYTGCLK